VALGCYSSWRSLWRWSSPGTALGAHHLELKRRRRKHEIHSLIKAVVVVVMVNRNFGHILGELR
jgi:phospholipase C